FRSATNNDWPHPAHVNVPARFSCSSAHDPGRSVSCSRSTAYCSGVRIRRHSSSVFWTGKAIHSLSMASRVRGDLEHLPGFDLVRVAQLIRVRVEDLHVRVRIAEQLLGDAAERVARLNGI